MSEESALKDFFISYTGADRAWAEWIGWELEASGYTVVLQAWDFALGTDFVGQMDRATQETRRTLVVLSPRYLAARYTQAEWHAAFRRDPTGEQGLLLPVRIEDCGPDFGGLLANLAWLDLVGLEAEAAREYLLAGVRQRRGKPLQAPAFPSGVPHTMPQLRHFPAQRPAYWRVPFDRNPLFTGREEVLAALEQALTNSGQAALTQALTGLGGIGKTQTALEYAYRYQHRYQAVLWVQAETPALLPGEFVALAEVLELPEAHAPEQEQGVIAVQRWLATEEGWLLVLDNVETDDLERVLAFLPARRGGHVLFTTRAQAVRGLAQPVPLALPDTPEACRFLLRRAGLEPPDPTAPAQASGRWAEAEELVEALGALPLALDQAGAYIEETRCGLKGYLDLYRQQRRVLLRRRGAGVSDHPESVALTWTLAFKNVRQASPAAADLLRLCAFLHPEAIPEDLFTEGAQDLPPGLQKAVNDPLRWNAALAALRRFSLIERQTETGTLSLHRLVQAVLQDALPAATRRVWAERVVRLVNTAFPDVEFVTWERCQRLLPHALLCAAQIEARKLTLLEAARLLNQTGSYLYERAQYAQAEPLHQQALAIREQVFGPGHPDVATSLNNLAELYYAQGRLAEAEPLYQQALAIREQALGLEHPNVTESLNNLALLYQSQGRLAEAEPLYQRACSIDEQALGLDHPDVATDLNNLASLYRAQGRLAEAEPLLQRALVIFEQVLGPEHSSTRRCRNNLALLVEQRKRARKPSWWQKLLLLPRRSR